MVFGRACAEVPAINPFYKVFWDTVGKAGLSPFLSGFGTHGDISWPMGFGKPPTVNFGLGDPARAHQSNERVSVRDLVDRAKAIALAIEQWCR